MLTRVGAPCAHVDEVRTDWGPVPEPVCEDCVRAGERGWVSLRRCLTCGHVGCCDSSPNKHATKHFRGSGHPIVVSAEPGETWSWCFVDEREVGS